MNIIRKAELKDLQEIYRIQDVSFRDHVFIEPLESMDEFIRDTKRRMEADGEFYYVQEFEGSIVGFIRLLKKNDWEVLTWGKWLNTLLYATGIVAFEKMGLPKVIFAVRFDNKRVVHLYKKHNFRNVGQDFVCYRPNILAPIRTTNVTLYEITAEEFWEKAEDMKKNSLPLKFL
jgi:RimJ/RimL family protein N-acetyltransferase